jgi:class 3 adenylate cyclase
MRKFRWFLGAFLLVLCTSMSGQNVYYSDDSDNYKVLANRQIETSGESVSLTWTTNDSFHSPFIIIQKSEEGDTLNELQTQLSSVIIKTSSLEKSKVEIRSESGRKTEISIFFKSETDYSLVIYIGIGVALLIFLLVLRGYKKRSKTLAISQMETASIRRTKKFDCVTVLFADIQGFTKIVETMNPEQLVDELDRYFIYFDELVEKYSVEKIKTIGDSYMCAGGVPDVDSANPIEVVLVALGMIAYVNNRQSLSSNFWNIRIGINTGPVISGTLGFKKKAFDIWGDSVNIASRMESSSEPGEIHITSDT